MNNLDNRRQTVAVSVSGKRTTWRALAINNPHRRGDPSAITRSTLLPPGFSDCLGSLSLVDIFGKGAFSFIFFFFLFFLMEKAEKCRI